MPWGPRGLDKVPYKFNPFTILRPGITSESPKTSWNGSLWRGVSLLDLLTPRPDYREGAEDGDMPADIILLLKLIIEPLVLTLLIK